MEPSEVLTLDSLTNLVSDVEPYVLNWLSGDQEDIAEALVLVLHVRPGGFLAAVSIGLVPEEALAVGNGPSPPGAVGPSTVVTVQGAVLDNGVLSPTGTTIAAVVVDFAESVLSHMHALRAFSPLQFSF
jgi:hypothetical protein